MLEEEVNQFLKEFSNYGESLLSCEYYTPLVHRVLSGMTGIGLGTDPKIYASNLTNIRMLWSALVDMDTASVSEEFGGPSLAERVKKVAIHSAPAIVFLEMAERGSKEEIVSYFRSQGSRN